MIVVSGLCLVGDSGECASLDGKRSGVKWICREFRDHLVIPYDRGLLVYGAILRDEEDFLLGTTIVLVQPVADVLFHIAVLHFHQTGTRQFDAKVALSPAQRRHSFRFECVGGRLDAEDRGANIVQLSVVDDELRRAEIDIRLDYCHGLPATYAIGLAVTGLYGKSLGIRCGVGGDDGVLIIGHAIADGAELFVGHERADRCRGRRENASRQDGRDTKGFCHSFTSFSPAGSVRREKRCYHTRLSGAMRKRPEDAPDRHRPARELPRRQKTPGQGIKPRVGLASNPA